MLILLCFFFWVIIGIVVCINVVISIVKEYYVFFLRVFVFGLFGMVVVFIVFMILLFIMF